MLGYWNAHSDMDWYGGDRSRDEPEEWDMACRNCGTVAAEPNSDYCDACEQLIAKEAMPAKVRMEFVRSGCRDIKIMLDQMIARRGCFQRMPAFG